MGPLCRPITAGRRPATVSDHTNWKLALAIVVLLTPLDSLYLEWGLRQGQYARAGSQKLKPSLPPSPLGERGWKWIFSQAYSYVHHWLKGFFQIFNGLRAINAQSFDFKMLKFWVRCGIRLFFGRFFTLRLRHAANFHRISSKFFALAGHSLSDSKTIFTFSLHPIAPPGQGVTPGYPNFLPTYNFFFFPCTWCYHET